MNNRPTIEHEDPKNQENAHTEYRQIISDHIDESRSFRHEMMMYND